MARSIFSGSLGNRLWLDVCALRPLTALHAPLIKTGLNSNNPYNQIQLAGTLNGNTITGSFYTDSGNGIDAVVGTVTIDSVRNLFHPFSMQRIRVCDCGCSRKFSALDFIPAQPARSAFSRKRPRCEPNPPRTPGFSYARSPSPPFRPAV